MPGDSWLRDQLAFLIVVLGLAAAFTYLLVQPGHWARGTAAIALVVIVAGLLRLVLPTARAGLLAVRSRAADSLFFFVIGGLILGVCIRLRS